MTQSRLKAGVWSLALGLAVLVRLVGITHGARVIYNADEPHILHLAVSFGSGTLKPYALKYPTLWPYLLFFCYGLYFLVWSGFGLKHGIDAFASLYAWDPASFILLARGLSATLSLLAAWVAWRAQREIDRSDKIPWAFLLLAFAPAASEMSHTAKPDDLMLFFSACAWFWGIKVLREPSRRAHWACGACLGLAGASQYTAFPLASILPLAHVLSRRRPARRFLWEGLGAAALAFFLGSPYCVLNPGRFLATLRDFSALNAMNPFSRWGMAWRILHQDLLFAGPWLLPGIAAAGGILALAFWRRERRLAAFLLAPPALYLLLLSTQFDGFVPRYSFAIYPGLAVAAGVGLSELARGLAPRESVLAALILLGPGYADSWAHAHRDALEDTRDIAAAWIEKNIPQGSVILADQAHSEPRLVMEKAEVEELYEKTKRSGSLRNRLYQAMLRKHPGGGYRIWLLPRSAADLVSNPSLVARSQADSPVLEGPPSLSLLRKKKIRYVLFSSFGATSEKSPELGGLFVDVPSAGKRIARFEPVPGRIAGPVLDIYDLDPKRR
jgi:4-amino-4-deoxy-L-arabinose transferase-like glycosyltransferase